ncbi:MAG: helix-turn-helix domain-containing protein [Planctomycetes bacterium]|nr:helix-turn-helix domain-containing protein [Planctomycetota bacterium]
MPRRVLPNPENCSLRDLEVAANGARSRRSRDRMMAIRALLLSEAFESVYRIFIVSPRTLQRWVARFNERGIDGLIDEVSVYDKALSPERIAEHFAAASVIVPEPSGLTIGLVLAGMLAAVGRRRRRK